MLDGISPKQKEDIGNIYGESQNAFNPTPQNIK